MNLPESAEGVLAVLQHLCTENAVESVVEWDVEQVTDDLGALQPEREVAVANPLPRRPLRPDVHHNLAEHIPLIPYPPLEL